MVTGIFPGTAMTFSCELCHREALEHVYTPDGGTRGLKVFLCTHCGLVQSLPRIDRTEDRRPAAVSGGADWGNVRYGKGFRTKQAMDAVAQHADLFCNLSLLDVGSNRGSFARAFLDAAPDASMAAVEPDERFAQSCGDLPRTELINARIEAVPLETERFDIVHSCHTIEHLAHPASVLSDHWRVLKSGGLLVLDAPNLALIGSDDILEEWFIDKHLYHFTAGTLIRMVEAAVFTIIGPPDACDFSNILLVGRKNGRHPSYVGGDMAEVEHAQDLIARYVATRASNLTSLTAMTMELASLKPRRIAMWGAGRLFDSLVMHGKFDALSLSLLIDKHLRKHVSERHGCAVAAPEDLSGANADVVVVMSRDFASEIVAEVRERAPSAEIILYTDLLARARQRFAA